MKVDSHAVARLRERWPSSRASSNEKIEQFLVGCVHAAKEDVVHAPGGDYYPFTCADQSGYIVVVDEQVKTVMPSKWCPEVEEIHERRRRKDG